MSSTEPVNPMSFAGKETVLDVVRRERADFYKLVEDPANWDVMTRCEGWTTGDMVRHMIDVTEAYLERWEVARQGGDAEAVGLTVMGETLNQGVIALRGLGQEEAIKRLKTASDKMMAIFDSLTEDEWSNFNVPHAFMGPLPTFFYPAFHVMDYGVHTWDIRYGLGEKLRKLDLTTAGVLIPYMFILMQYTVDQASAAGLELNYGLEVSSGWGGKWRVSLKDGQWQAEEEKGNFEGLDAVFSFDPSDFVLTSFQRFPGGAARGDHEVIEKARQLFFTI